MADRALLSLTDLHEALTKRGLSICDKTLKKRSDELGLAFARFNGQRVYRPADVAKIAEKLDHYRAGKLPNRGKRKPAISLAHMPLEIKLAEIGLKQSSEDGRSVGHGMFSRCAVLSDDDLSFYAGLAADARGDFLRGQKLFSAEDVAEDRDLFLGGILQRYRELQKPPHASFANMDARQRAQAAGIASPETEARIIADDLYAAHPMMDRESLLEHLRQAASLRAKVLQERCDYAFSEVSRDLDIYVQTAADRYTAHMCAGPSSAKDVN